MAWLRRSFYGLLAFIGVGLTVGSIYLFLRGPYLHGPPIPMWMIVPLGIVFIIGTMLVPWAGARLLGIQLRL